VIDYHGGIIERIKRASTFRVGLPYYQGEAVVEFDVRGAAKEMNSVICK